MNTKQDFNNKIEEIMNILKEPMRIYTLTSGEIEGEYEKKLNRIAEECGALNAMVKNSKLEEGS